jgi:flagellar biosynthesis/type III secretory pathway chaperone
LKDCTQRADEIIALLEEESTALRSLNSAGLIPLLPQKEHLFIELKARIECLAAEEDSVEDREDPVRAPLRDRLHRIARLNQGNRAFIENTLSYYQDFLNCLCPCVYGRGQEGRPERAQVPLRGVAFKKEI